MSDITLAPREPVPTATTSVFVATFAGVLAAIFLMLFLDLFLARIDRRESDAHAAAEYAAGLGLLAAGRAAAATEHFGSAVAIDRENTSYALALGEAMLADGRIVDAEATLRTLLERAENDGAVNLAMAHAMLREGRPDDAIAYFHRAIFGRWRADSVARRRTVQFELIDLLATRRAARQLLAELLPFEETSPDSVALRRRLGQLFLVAGSPARAAGIFREVLRRDPRDAVAYAGMGEAALALGNFRTARADLVEALRLQPDDSAIARRLVVADTVLALDPTARGIGSHARYVRSRVLLDRTVAALSNCGPGTDAALPDSARRLLAAVPKASSEESMSETLTVLASDLWISRAAVCPAVGARNEALRLVHARLAQ